MEKFKLHSSFKKNHLLILFIYVITSFVLMLPTSLSPSSKKFGNFVGSDSFAHIYHSFTYDSDNELICKNNKDNSCNLGYPYGVPKKSTFSKFKIMSIFGNFFNPILTYNLIIYFSFVLSGYFMYLLLSVLKIDTYSAFLSGFIYSASPFHILQSADHPYLAQVWIFPLAFLSIYLFTQKIDLKSLLITFSTILLALYIHGYWGYFLTETFIIIIIYLICTKKIIISKNLLLKIILATVFIIAFGIVLAVNQGMIKTADGFRFLERPINDLYTYGLRLREYIQPPFYSNLFSDYATNYWRKNNHGSNPAEMTIFLGYFPIGLTVYFLINYFRKEELRKQIPTNLFSILIIFGTIPILLGINPSIKIIDYEIPTLTMLRYKIFPIIRTNSRYAIQTIFTISFLSGLAFHIILPKLKCKIKATYILSALLVVILEFFPIRENFYLDSKKVPPVYEYLKTKNKIGPVLELPYHWGEIPTFWHTYHKHPLFNPPHAILNHPNRASIKKMQQIKSLDQLIKTAKNYGIKYLIIHSPKKIPKFKSFRNKISKNIILPKYATYSNLFIIE